MASFFSNLFQWFASFFLSKTAEIAIVGLQASGKTSFVNVIGSGQVKRSFYPFDSSLQFQQWSEDVVPTVGFIFRKVRKGNVTLKIWDVAGQPKFRSMWERYCHGVDAIVFIIDSADPEKFNTARFELHQLLGQPALIGVPLLVLGNKNDLEGHVPVKDLIRDLQLDKISDRPVSCYSVCRPSRASLTMTLTLIFQCSMKSQHNLDIVLQWLAGRSH
ncbi:P-loop containing nucleoside triphosphate hydrolase protein [Roridomyces roridus]|uniref:P-loop containing nucleoside triphosphate hydrolase protein n=1 Tax=Roridomyces roridus TaxID=1738132 RepID=A0AAD7FUI7_9AGAR|nr:P-loop containing nucleoside triphosphate hydrolase protein [Roridomyces roridus]